MYIGWLKYGDVPELIKIAEEVGWLLDGYHVKLMMMHAPHLCYGAYEEGVLVGAVMAIEFEFSAMIKYFMVKPTHQKQGIGRRLFTTLFGVLKDEHPSLYLHANPDLRTFFEKSGFESVMEVGRFLNVGKVPPFSFTNAQAKELDGGNFDATIRRIDLETFGEDRMAFMLDEMERNSSLKFALPNSFQHSSVINARGVYLGPWQCREGFEEEAEKMMQGVLYFRGLKKVIADVPMDNQKAVELFERYHFQKKGKFLHMVYGKGKKVKFENIYSFSL
ncbi:MAG: GNAT family N-acetyltransferase [Sulfuricurvum sp.]|jgi:ribosomal protein S18 acetylase RimI-like enzyme|uniref:GNAT family N-acetyltransferase n=1 Tax=Sulfuricurvum sp. TaxID=2025608 RepID=UPI0025CDF950|nr:GNAT family N-acetyltransferase [Sulfuricurvum sp.]MCK9372049.1 GNAT family N-acetyltransferase [Sulfuricurvum sp.]